MSNAIHILQKFKTDTDAVDTNKGFYYQYLVTIVDWLDNYLNKNDVDIYCETEDDIKAEDLKNKKVTFTQVKAYAKDFDIKAEEVQKSILNFFHLYVEYRNNGFTPEFIFLTSSGFSGDFFDNVTSGACLSKTEKDKCIKTVKDILYSKYETKSNKRIAPIDKQIKEVNDFIDERPKPKGSSKKAVEKRKKSIREYNVQIKHIDKELDDLKEFIKTNLDDFISKIKWVADNKVKDESISDLLDNINSKIASVKGFELDLSTAYAHLIKKVLIASQSINIEDRKLNRVFIDSLIEEAKNVDDFKKGLQNAELLDSFWKLCKYHEIQLNLLNRVLKNQDDLKTRQKEILKEVTDGFSNQKNQCIPTPNCFSEYQNDAFDYAEGDFYKKTYRKVKEVTPKIIFQEFKEKLFYPHKPNEESVLEILADKDVNKEIWMGWFELIVIIYICKQDEFNIENLIVSEVNKDTIIKPYFTQEKKYSDFIEELLDDDCKIIENRSCLVFNSIKPLKPDVYPRSNIDSILNSIYPPSSSIDELNPIAKRKFGLINFGKIRDVISMCTSMEEVESAIKQLFSDVIN